MKKKLILFAIILFLITNCGKDDGPLPIPPDPLGNQTKNQEPESENSAPGSFSLLSPPPSSDGISRIPEFIWEQATDPDGDEVTYTVLLGTEDDPFTIVAESLNTTTYSPSEALEFEGVYHWRVEAKDVKGAVMKSISSSFIIEPMPIVLLQKVTSMVSRQINWLFDYEQNLLKTASQENTGQNWDMKYDSGSKKLMTVTRNSPVGTAFMYDYSYSSAGKQREVRFSQFISSEIWSISYDVHGRLVTHFTSQASPVSSSNTISTLSFFDEKSDRPYEINIESSGANPITGAFKNFIKINLEWNGSNIVSMTYEIDNDDGDGFQFSRREEYTYDNNINPYNIILKDQFGFDDFYISNLFTGMESIHIYGLNWQSANNILTRKTYQNQNDSMTEITYDYTYTDDYYPKTAIARRMGNDVDENIEWFY